MAGLTIDEFRAREGDSFELRFGDRSLPFTLARVNALPDTGRDGGAFTLDWVGPYEPVLAQDIYVLSHGGDDFEMFIVPVARDRDGAQYEAVFN